MNIEFLHPYTKKQTIVKEPWKRSNFYCLQCSKKNVWYCDDGGDYYQGEKHICLECEFSFNLPSYPQPFNPNDKFDNLRMEQLRKNKNNE